ncbi:hypothetical protein [Microbacterium sp. PAMC21962]|uniref:hypothetical protein n=1 Tax=Microbacterium sp. PAMC21962 TaxID=2861280 RepID=UPI001C629799|nr:hypothetical protein [Microbacterium sp. PAMC21962]QYF98487.1 hypothetical protein KY498_04370 [Microbacterium sp. PAMC21962]
MSAGDVTAEIAVREQARQEVAARFDGASGAMTTFLADLQVAYEIASRLVTTSFVPQSYANKPQEAAAAIVAGQGVGLGPMESLRSIDIIQGTPAMRAIALRAIVVSAGHEMWLEESTATRCVYAGRRRGSDVIQRSTWDMQRAQAMNLTGKDNWRKQPGAMLVARATAECARLVAADALLGIPYSSEELQDLDAPAAATRTAPRQLQTVAARSRAASEARAAVDTPAMTELAPSEPTQPPVSGSTEAFPCDRCGEPAVEKPGSICEPCEAEVEAEIAGADA